MKKKLKLRILLLLIMGLTTPMLANVSSKQIIAPGTNIGLSIIDDQQEDRMNLTMEDSNENQWALLIIFIFSVTSTSLANYYYLIHKKNKKI